MAKSSKHKLALVLSGGGARGAYEAGVLHYVRTMLPPKSRNRAIDIQCGASVGALNTCFMASTAHDLAYQGRELRSLWENVREENVYQRNLGGLFEFLTTSTKGFLWHLLKGTGQGSPHFPGVLDTKPFLPFIQKVVPWKKIRENIRGGFVQAVSIVATNVFTGRLELFVDKSDSIEYSGAYIVHEGPILPVHAAASAAIPVVFPVVMIEGVAYTDGGLRLNTPLSPAIQLGADSIFVIGLNHRAKVGEAVPSIGELGKLPSLGQVLGRVMNAVFLDKIQYDLEQLERINRVIDWSEDLYGKEYLGDLNTMIAKKNIRGDVASRGLKRLNILRIRPSQDIAQIFSRCFQRGKDKHFGSFEKFLIRALDIDPRGGTDFLSYLCFMPEYLKELLDLGFEDARQQHNQLKEFFER